MATWIQVQSRRRNKGAENTTRPEGRFAHLSPAVAHRLARWALSKTLHENVRFEKVARYQSPHQATGSQMKGNKAPRGRFGFLSCRGREQPKAPRAPKAAIRSKNAKIAYTSRTRVWIKVKRRFKMCSRHSWCSRLLSALLVLLAALGTLGALGCSRRAWFLSVSLCCSCLLLAALGIQQQGPKKACGSASARLVP